VTLGAWTRWDTLLAAVAALAAAAAAFADPLETAWLKIGGLVAAALAAAALVVVKTGRARLEAGRERVEADSRLRVPVGPITNVDPTEIGVERAAQTILPGGERPSYLPRTQDHALRAAITEALAGRGRWLIVVVGQSKVGKSRTLFEALHATAAIGRGRVAQMVAPVDGDALKALLLPGQGPRYYIRSSAGRGSPRRR
jgi:hypothetical protein